MLWRLIAATPGISHAVFSLTGTGVLSDRLRMAGANLVNDERDRGKFRDLASLRNRIVAYAPDVIQGWMYHGNLAAQLMRSAAPHAALLWNVRQSLTDRRLTKPTTRTVIRALAFLSRAPDAIIYNADSAADDHEALGFVRDKRVILPNGFDTALFKPDLGHRRTIRAELGLSDDQLAIGFVARFDPWKNHEGFFQMAARVAERHPAAAFVLAGKGMEWSNPALVALIGADLRDRVTLLGDRRDVPAINAALDIACNVSHGEGFPNAVGEAMACELPCMVTPVGASADLVGDCGILAKSPRSDDLFAAMTAMLAQSTEMRMALGIAARQRIVNHFSIEVVAKRYLNLYALAADRSAHV
ncbi:glycosyltransferase [Sphingomonas taxi]|nr:glycosyltransferase [Sphingomonas taxi]